MPALYICTFLIPGPVGDDDYEMDGLTWIIVHGIDDDEKRKLTNVSQNPVRLCFHTSFLFKTTQTQQIEYSGNLIALGKQPARGRSRHV